MLFNLFGSKSKLGIDIGTSAIKIVELSRDSGRWKMENYGIYEFKSPDGSAGTPATIMDLPDQEISRIIKDVLVAAGMKSREAVATVSSFLTFATVIEMPYVSEEALAKAIPLEARKYIPVPLDQVVLDWSIVGVPPNERPASANVTVEVFLAAVPKDETARYQRITKEAGLNLAALELENSSLVRAVLGNDLSPTAVLNIGGRSTSIVIVSKGYERLAHNYEIGGYEMTKAVVNALGISADRAETLKRKYGMIDSSENKARSPILPLVDMIAFETRKTIEAYEQSRGQKIQRAVLVGGLANMPGFPQYVKERISRDLLLGDVFARLVYPQELAPVAQVLSNVLAIAVGAAMRKV